ncbi:MAG: thiamine pyrophosphate-dependent dehydrogenase E1 component subunit alpha [Lactobacillales bacterium]|jgi:pyruvate dehydrogenase E1 component alpha subunit|nr:thiamine pyrophosphate-dependent dehydrogenase E1 component subunit alpha [Lactobacillales bacterium]
MNKEKMKNFLTQMWRIRLFEEKLQELYQEGKIHGTMHLCIGQEAVAVGAMSVLRADDLMTSTHRNHGHSIAKGMSVRGMLAEILGKETGINHGKGGSMHLSDISVGALASNGIVGGGFPIAAGAALASQMQNIGQVVVCFAGDGAINQGVFHEAANLVAIWSLPVLFVIENNQYAMSSDIQKMVKIDRLSKRAESYGMDGITIDGNDVELVANTVNKATKKARDGKGPTFIEAITYRQAGHSKSDEERYRKQEERDHWIEVNDPIFRLERKGLDEAVLSREEIMKIREEMFLEIQELMNLVEQDDEPSSELLYNNVYAGRVGELID